MIVFGWLPVTFGLGWWSTVTASVVGLTVGTLVTAPLALLGPRTGTNNTVSSGAHFGVTGRLVGSGLTLVFALAYAAIAVWTSGDALVASAHRLVGTPIGDGALAVGYALIATEIAVVALYGHAPVVALQKIVVPVVGALLLAGVVAFAGSFDPGYAGGEYLLGGFWPTWALAIAVAAAGPLSYAPSLGDYTRRISRRHGDARVFAAAAAGVFGGLLATTLFGAFTASTFTTLGDSYVTDLVAAAPGWYVLPLLVIGLAGGVGQGRAQPVRERARPRGAHPAPEPRPHHADHLDRGVRAALRRHVHARRGRLDHGDDAGPQRRCRALGDRQPARLPRRPARAVRPARPPGLHQGRRGGRYWFTGG